MKIVVLRELFELMIPNGKYHNFYITITALHKGRPVVTFSFTGYFYAPGNSFEKCLAEPGPTNCNCRNIQTNHQMYEPLFGKLEEALSEGEGPKVSL